MNDLEQSDQPLEQKLAEAMARLTVAMRADDWDWFGAEALNPTQGKILIALQKRRDPMRLSEVSDELSVTAATVSDSVATLVDKGLVLKGKASDDKRAVALRLSAKAKRLLGRYAKQTPAIQAAFASLPETDKVALYRSMLHVIRHLQLNGRISVARMCVTCEHFRPYAHEGERPHHCALVNLPLGDRTLRTDCQDHEPAAPTLASQNWATFTAG